tara:strand:- start:334 stop:579 length:246 start_codon:yes stop_codon:yes gene_type:complete
MFAVPSRNRSPHSLVAAPIFRVPSASGIKLLPTDVSVDTPLMFNASAVVTPATIKSPNTVAPIAVVANRFVSLKYSATAPS